MPELREIAPAWSQVKQIVAIQPRLARKDKIGPRFKHIAPELFDEELKKSSPSPDSRWGHAPVLGVIPRNYLDTSAEDLFKELDIPVGASMGAISWNGVMDRRPRLMWEHEGQCQCGRKTYLAGQCRKCASEDATERHSHAERQAVQEAEAAVGDYELVVTVPGSTPGAAVDPEHDEVVAWLEKGTGSVSSGSGARVHTVLLNRSRAGPYDKPWPIWERPSTLASKIFLISHNWMVSAYTGIPTTPSNPNFQLVIGLDWPEMSFIFVKRWPAGQSLTLPVPYDPSKFGNAPRVDPELFQYRISMFSTDRGETWQALQNCGRISQEVSHVVDAAFRRTIKAERVDTCVICTKNGRILITATSSLRRPAFC